MCLRTVLKVFLPRVHHVSLLGCHCYLSSHDSTGQDLVSVTGPFPDINVMENSRAGLQYDVSLKHDSRQGKVQVPVNLELEWAQYALD